MRTLTVALGVGLGASLLANVLAFARLGRAEPRPLPARAAIPRAEERPAPVLPEVSLPPVERREAPAVRAGLPAAALRDPAVAEILAREEKLEGLWSDLVRLSRLGRALEAGKYRELVCRVTAERLGLDAGTLQAAALDAVRDVDRVQREMEQAFLALPEDLEPSAFEAREEEIRKRYLDSRNAALGRLEVVLAGTPLASRAGDWIDYLMEVKDTPPDEVRD